MQVDRFSLGLQGQKSTHHSAKEKCTAKNRISIHLLPPRFPRCCQFALDIWQFSLSWIRLFIRWIRKLSIFHKPFSVWVFWIRLFCEVWTSSIDHRTKFRICYQYLSMLNPLVCPKENLYPYWCILLQRHYRTILARSSFLPSLWN